MVFADYRRIQSGIRGLLNTSPERSAGSTPAQGFGNRAYRRLVMDTLRELEEAAADAFEIMSVAVAKAAVAAKVYEAAVDKLFRQSRQLRKADEAN